MKIVAETVDGYLIQATETEIAEILNAVIGEKREKICIGQKIPAIDYATTIRKIKLLQEDYNYKTLIERIECFNKCVGKLRVAVEKANEIEA